jgi:hypothetical protein
VTSSGDDDLSREVPHSPNPALEFSNVEFSKAGASKVEVAQDDDLAEKELPSVAEIEQRAGVELEETGIRLATAAGTLELNLKNLPGGMMNRASYLALVMALAVLAGYAAAGICKMGAIDGDATAGIGLGSVLAVIVLGLLWAHPETPK